MTQGSDYFGIYQVWLGHFLTEDLVIDADRVQHLQRHHHRFHYPYTKMGVQGFQRLETIQAQAFCQRLAHRGCIPSLLLLGLSLSTAYGDSRRVICDVSGYQYAFLAVGGILLHCEEPGFWEECQLFFHNPLLYQTCHYLANKWAPLGLHHHQHHPVIQFCEMLTKDFAETMKYDA